MTKKKRQRLLIFILCLLVLAILSYRSTNEVANVPPGEYLVTHVTDGDTFDVKSSTGTTDIVRLIGIDTPETHDPRKNVQCYGPEASAESTKLLNGKLVKLASDPTDSDRDKYQRLLRYVYLPDGTFLNQFLVEQGYAFAYVIFPNVKLDQFKAWEAEAHTANRGLWAHCTIDSSTDIKQTNSIGPVPTN